MTPERWARIKEVFSAALETPEPERPRFLESACGGDADLRAEVERMLAGNEGPSLLSPAANAFTAAAPLAPGDMVVTDGQLFLYPGAKVRAVDAAKIGSGPL